MTACLGEEGLYQDGHAMLPRSGRCQSLLKRDTITAHGFRSTFSDRASEVSSFRTALAHAIQNKAERAYCRGDALAKRRKMMEAWAGHCGSFSASQHEPQTATNFHEIQEQSENN
jgi:hypothetical protein